MYEPLLLLHSWVRWLILLSLIYFLAKSIKGAFFAEKWSANEESFLWAFNQAFGYQVLFGLTLWLGQSPLVKAGFREPHLILNDSVVSFWALRHPLTMIFALGAFHMAKARAKRVAPEEKFKHFAITFGLILILIASAIPWPTLSYGRPLLRWLG